MTFLFAFTVLLAAVFLNFTEINLMLNNKLDRFALASFTILGNLLLVMAVYFVFKAEKTLKIRIKDDEESKNQEAKT